ncbi:MAG TPA: hypothetical protein VGA67_00195 [Candidatus Dojkabacteria bacterium]|jgi:hypothetical protein
MSNTLKIENIEIENQVVFDALVDVLKNDKNLLESVKKSIFSQIELLDTRNESEKRRTK